MLITGIKSRPQYDQLRPMAGDLRHVLVAQGSGGAALLRLLNDMTPAQRQHTCLLYSRQSFSGHDHAQALAAIALAEYREYSSNSALLSDLDQVLDQACMGTRLYLAGSESFIGTAMQVSSRYDLNHDEVLREHSGSLVRRVWCVHCDTYSENVQQRLFKCPGCGVDLIVRDHYSRRLAAFQAVKADGEVPGELPQAEELDT
jgi:predicted RNA-binding Zn-ribbon protein involved in translation (DUF1610 family)